MPEKFGGIKSVESKESREDFHKTNREVEGSCWRTLNECSDEMFLEAEMLDVRSFPSFFVDNHTKNQFIWIADVFKGNHIAFFNDSGNKVLAVGFCAPIHLEDGHLPEGGWEGGIKQIISGYKEGKSPNALMALSASVSPEMRGQGMGGKILSAYLERARELGMSKLIAPVRPSGKNKFPDLSMKEYATVYNKETGKHVDSWVRSHLRHGGKIMGIGKNSHVVHAIDGSWPSVEKWQEWTGMKFPKDGEYDIPQGNAKLHIHDGIGEYREDCIWIEYDVDRTAS